MAVEFTLPDIGEGITEGEVVKWLVNVGDSVEEDQAIVEIMTDKVTAEIPSPCAGTVQKLNGQPGEVILVGSVIAVIDKLGESTEVANVKHASSEQPEVLAKVKTSSCSLPAEVSIPEGVSVSSLEKSEERVLAAPATRRLARELGVDLKAVAGTGPNRRVTQADVKQAVGSSSNKSPVNRVSDLGSVKPLTEADKEERRPFIGVRRKIADHLTLSKQKAPHFAYVEEVDMTRIVEIRKQLKPEAELKSVKLTFLPFVIKAVVAALQEYPTLNSMLDETTNELVLKKSYHIGIAAATDGGLIVPVLKHAEHQSLLHLADGVQDLAARARTGKLKPEELSGGTFTLTSIGSIGGLFGIPIINYPEAAIMGINKIVKRPMVIERNGEDVIEIRHMMNLSLAADHRIVDGAEAAMFVNRVVDYLEQPEKLLLL